MACSLRGYRALQWFVTQQWIKNTQGFKSLLESCVPATSGLN